MRKSSEIISGSSSSYSAGENPEKNVVMCSGETSVKISGGASGDIDVNITKLSTKSLEKLMGKPCINT